MNSYITTPAFGHPFFLRRGIFAPALVVRQTKLITNREFDKYLIKRNNSEIIPCSPHQICFFQFAFFR